MSSLYLPLAFFAIFFAALLAGVATQVTLADRRKAVRLLEAQVTPGATNLWEDRLSRPFAERAMGPLVGVLGAAARRLTPLGVRQRIAHKLALAGSPKGWDAERVAAFKVIGLVSGLGFGVLMATATHRTGVMLWAIPVLFALGGFLIPGATLGQRVVNRQEGIRRALPDTMDLLTISVEAGLGFDAALAHVIKTVPGPLSQEIGRMLHEVQLGVSRVDAFRHLGERTNVEELNAFILAMIQADLFGVSISKVLRAQAKEQRTRRRQRAERKAMQTPIKLLFPLIFCILPALLVVVVGPGAIQIYRQFFGG